jgi:hypothetical protein
MEFASLCCGQLVAVQEFDFFAEQQLSFLIKREKDLPFILHTCSLTVSPKEETNKFNKTKICKIFNIKF